MSLREAPADTVRVEVENLGGIEQTELDFAPGVTVLTGRNATNRTSLLRAIMAALGSDDATLKGDADSGSVTLTLGEETYTRTFERDDTGVSVSGDPYIPDATVADLFAFLLGSNEARQAVKTKADLRDVVMRPVDTAGINAEIDRLEAEKRTIEDELDDLDDIERRRDRLREERAELDGEIEAVESELAAERDELSDTPALDSVADHRDAVESTLTELKETRTDLSRLRTRRSSEQESLAALEDERAELREQLADLPETPADRLERTDAELDRLREHKRSLEATITQLGQVIQFNESMLDGEHDAIRDALRDDDEGELADQLLPENDEVVCWTCGSSVDSDAIDGTLDALRSLRSERVTERSEIGDEIDELQSEKRTLQERRDERTRVERRLDDIEAEIERREGTIADLDADIEGLEASVTDLEATLEDHDQQDFGDLLERHRRINEHEVELERLEEERAGLTAEIDDLEERLADQETLENQLESVSERLNEERTRIDRLEASVVETFNEHMEAVLSLLDYENIERIWLERRGETDSRGPGTDRRFELHVVRDMESGAAYEDTIDTLSESEREVAGLVFALAGYLAHEVYETVPFVLLDSLEAIDSDRIATLVEYFAEYAPYLVVALLEEDAAAVDDDAERIRMR